MKVKPPPPPPLFFSSTRNRILACLAVLLLALSARIFSNASHFFLNIDPGYRNFEMCDSSYQIRRSEMIVNNFPHVPFFDTYHYYPDQPAIPWPAGYNLFLATFGKATQIMGGDRLAQESVMGLVPCVVDALTTLLFLLLAAQFVSFGTAVMAGFLLALSTQNIGYAEVGYVDHHYFITFLMVGLAWLFHLYETKPGFKSAVGLGVLAGAVSFFNVSSIQYALLALLAVIILAFQRRSEISMRQYPSLVFGAALFVSFLAAFTTPAGRALQWRYDQTTLFQFGLILSLALFHMALAWGWRKGQRFNWTPAVLCFSLLLGLVIFLFKDIREGFRFLFVGNLLNYIQGEETSIRGYFPLWATVFTGFVFFAPFGLAQIRHWFKNRPGFTTFFFLLFFHGLFTGLSHFLYVQYFYPWFALAAAYGMDWFLNNKSNWLGSARYAVLLIFLGQAGYVSYVEVFNVGNGEDRARQAIKQTIEAFAWLREHSPVTSHFEKGDGRPEYSVMAHRDHGHMIVRIAHRPVVVSPFSTPDFTEHMKDYARLSLLPNEDEVVAIMKKYDARYLILDHRDNTMTSFLAQILKNEPDADRFHAQADQSKMSFFRNNLLYFDGELRWRKTPPVKYFRLIYETPLEVEIPLQTKRGVVKHKYNGLKIFELVSGAIIRSGGYRPQEIVKFKLPLKSNVGRLFNYTTIGVANNQGIVEVYVPYPTTNLVSSGIAPTAGAYDLESQSGSHRMVFVTEDDVSSGKTVKPRAF